MNDEHQTITSDGEILSDGSTSMVDISASVGLARAEIDMQIATARAYPRQPSRIQKSIFEMATLDEEAAKESMYALPRGGKPITGPSIRFAESVKQAFGNCRASSRVVEINRTEKYVEAEGVFFDLETNVATKITHRRRIVDKTGRLFKDDMILVTGNAACSIAMREAILKGVPKPIWRKGYDAVTQVVTGDIKTLADRRDRAVRAFAAYGITPEQVYATLGVGGEADITIDHLPVLFGMYSAIKNGEHTVEDIFAPPRSIVEQIHNPLEDKPTAPQKQPETATVAKTEPKPTDPEKAKPAAKTTKAAAKTYPLPDFVAACEAATHHGALENIREKFSSLLDGLTEGSDNWNEARLAFNSAHKRIEKAAEQVFIEGDQGGASDQGEAQQGEAGSDSEGEGAGGDQSVGQTDGEGEAPGDAAPTEGTDGVVASSETGGVVGTGSEVGEGISSAEIPEGEWSSMDRKWLTNSATKLAACKNLSAVVEFNQSQLGVFEFKKKATQAAFTTMLEAAKARVGRGASKL